MLPSYIKQLVYVACVHVVYGYTLHSTHRCSGSGSDSLISRCACECMHYCHQTVLHVFNRTCSTATVILA